MKKRISPTSFCFQISVPIRGISANPYWSSVFSEETFWLRKLFKSTHHDLTEIYLLSQMYVFPFPYFANSFFLLLRFKQRFSFPLAHYSHLVKEAVEVQLIHNLWCYNHCHDNASSHLFYGMSCRDLL